MSKYILVYFGGDKPASEEEGQKHFASYQQWLKSLGAAAVSPMNPLNHTTTINADGSVTSASATSMSGYTIVEADSMEAALDMARRCPFLDINGSLEVSELVQMPG